MLFPHNVQSEPNHCYNFNYCMWIYLLTTVGFIRVVVTVKDAITLVEEIDALVTACTCKLGRRAVEN